MGIHGIQEYDLEYEKLYYYTYSKGYLSDVVLKVTGFKFYAHKPILFSRSEYFRALVEVNIIIRGVPKT